MCVLRKALKFSSASDNYGEFVITDAMSFVCLREFAQETFTFHC